MGPPDLLFSLTMCTCKESPQWPGSSVAYCSISICCRIQCQILHYICCYVWITTPLGNILVMKYLKHCNFMILHLQHLFFGYIHIFLFWFWLYFIFYAHLLRRSSSAEHIRTSIRLDRLLNYALTSAGLAKVAGNIVSYWVLNLLIH